MNNDRRKQIATVREKVSELAATITELRDEEQEAYDNLPDGIRDGEQGGLMDQAISSLDEAIDALNQAQENLESAEE